MKTRKERWIDIAIIVALVVWFILHGTLKANQPIDELPITLDLTEMDTQDFAGTKFYQLKRGHLVLVVSTDPTNDAAKWMQKHVGERVTVVFSGKD